MTHLCDLLALPRYNDIQLLTEPQTANTHEIDSIDISETPDIANYIPKHTLLLTTGMSYQHNSQALIELLDSLKQADAIGIGIKVDRFLHQIDQTVIDHANAIDFPIFRIPDNYFLGTLLHQWLSIIWDEQYEEISFALDIQGHFQELVLNDSRDEIFIQDFSQMIKSPVILLDPLLEIITYSNHFKNHPSLAKYYVESLLEYPIRVRDETHYYTIDSPTGECVQIAVRPLNIHKYFSHYLLIVHPEQIPQPISHFAIDQAALALSFVLLKNDRVSQLQMTIEADYFKDWISNATESGSNQPIKYGFIPSDYYRVIKISSEQDGSALSKGAVSYRENLWLITQWLHKHLSTFIKHGKVIYSAANQETLILLQQPIEDLAEVLTEMANLLSGRLGIQIQYNLGKSVNTLAHVDRSQAQARLCYEERLQNHDDSTLLTYQDKGIRQLFAHFNGQDIQFFCQNVLGPFANLEDDSLSELRLTLHMYLNCQCEIARTANELYVHRNTVKYRIQKCEEILGIDVTEPTNSLNLRLALELLEEQTI